METFERGDATIAYSDTGPVPGQPTLVLLHAFPLDHRLWDAQRDLPARLVAPDARGFGASSPVPERLDVDLVADDVRALLDHLGVERAIVGGCSMGGYQSLAFARRHADRLAGLLLVDTKAAGDTPEQRAGRQAMIDAISEQGIDLLATNMLGLLVGETTRAERPDVVERVLELVRQQSVEAAVAALAGLASRPDATGLLAEVSVPVAVVVGAEDPLTPPDVAQAMAEQLADASFHVVAGAGHFTPMEAPENVNAAIEELVARVGE